MTSCGGGAGPEFRGHVHDDLRREFCDNVYTRFASTVSDIELSLAEISESFKRPSSASTSFELPGDSAASDSWLTMVFNGDARFEVLGGSPNRVKILRHISEFEYCSVLTPSTAAALHQEQPHSFGGLLYPSHQLNAGTGADSVNQPQVPLSAHSFNEEHIQKRVAWYFEKNERVTEYVIKKSGQLVYQTVDMVSNFVKQTAGKPDLFEETIIENLFHPKFSSPLALYCQKQVAPTFTVSVYERYDSMSRILKPRCDGLYPYFWKGKGDDSFSDVCPIYSNLGNKAACSGFNAAEGHCTYRSNIRKHKCVLCNQSHHLGMISYSNRRDCRLLHLIIEDLEKLGVDSESLKKVISDKRKFPLVEHIFESCLKSKQHHHQPLPVTSRSVHADIDRIGDKVAHDLANRHFATRFVSFSPKKPISSVIIDADALLEYAYESPMHSKQLKDNVGDIFQLFSIIEDKVHQLCSFFGLEYEKNDGADLNSHSAGSEFSKLVVFFSDASIASWNPALCYSRILLETFLKEHLNKYVTVYRASASKFQNFMKDHVQPFHDIPELARASCFMGSCSNRSSSLLLWFASIHYFSVFIFQDHIINQNKFQLFILEQMRYRPCDKIIFEICGNRYLEQFRINSIGSDSLSHEAPIFKTGIFAQVELFLKTTKDREVFIDAFTFAHAVSSRASFIVRLKNTMEFNRFKALHPNFVQVMLNDLSPIARDVFDYLAACLLKMRSFTKSIPPAAGSFWTLIDFWDATALQLHCLLEPRESFFQDFCSGKLLKDLFRKFDSKDLQLSKSNLLKSDHIDSVANQTTFHFSSKIHPRGLPSCFARYAEHANDGTAESMWHSACQEGHKEASDADMEALETLIFGTSVNRTIDFEGRIVFCECISTNGECKWCEKRGSKDSVPPLNSPSFSERYALFSKLLKRPSTDQECISEFVSNVVFKTKDNPTQLVCDAWDKFQGLRPLPDEPGELLFWLQLGRTCALKWAPFYIHSKSVSKKDFCLAYEGLTRYWVENRVLEDACAASMFQICVLNSGEPLTPSLFKRFLNDHGAEVSWASFHHHQTVNRGIGKCDILGLVVPDPWQRDVLDCVPNPFDFSQFASASLGANFVQTSVRSAVVQAPTSAGKTFLSLEIMRRFVYNSVQKSASTKDLVVYICPTKPLANMVYRDIANKFFQVLKTEHHIAGIFVKGLQLWVDRCKVLVTVPQMLDTLLWDASQVRLQRNISCVIVDEVHLITDPELGPVLERIFTTSSCPIYAFSGTVSGVTTFCDWIRKCERREVVEIPRNDAKSSLKQKIPRYTDLQFLQLCNTDTDERHLASRELHPWCHIRHVDEFDSAFPDLPSILPEMLFASLNWIHECGPELWRRLCVSLGLKDNIESVDSFFEHWFPANVADRAEWFVSLRNHIEKIDFVLRGVIKSAARDCREKLISVVQASNFSHQESSVSMQDSLDYVFSRHLFPCIAFSFTIAGCRKMFRDAQELLKKRKYKILPYQFSFAYSKIQFTLNQIHSEDVQEKLLIEFNYDASEFEHFMEGIKNRVAFHNGKMPSLARSYIEQLLNLGYFLIVSSTSTLATGMNTPCKCVLFPVEHFFLQSSNFLQGSGRAGRRGVEDRGIVVCCNFNTKKLHQRFIDIPDIEIVGHLPMNTSMILKMLIYLHQLAREHSLEGLARGSKSIQLMLNNPMFMLTRTDRDVETANRLKNGWHTTIAANLQALRILGCVNRYAEPSAFSYLASQFSYTEPAGLLMSFALSELFLRKDQEESKSFWKLTHDHHGAGGQPGKREKKNANQSRSDMLINVIRILRIFHASSHSYSGTRDLFSGAEMQPKVEMSDPESYQDFFAFDVSRTHLPPAHHNSLLHLAGSFNLKLATVWDIVSKQLRSECPNSWLGNEGALQELFPLSHATLRVSHPEGIESSRMEFKGHPILTWKSIASLWTSQDETNLIGVSMPDKLIHVTDMCHRKITQLHDVCPFVDANNLAYSSVMNFIPLILCNSLLSAYDICSLLKPPKRLEAVSRMIMDQRDDLRKIKTCFNNAKTLESMSHTPEYRKSLKERLRGLATKLHRNQTGFLNGQDAVILVCLPCTKDVKRETQKFLNRQFKRLFGFFLGTSVESAHWILTICLSPSRKNPMCHLCVAQCHPQKRASIHRSFESMEDFHFSSGVDGDKLWNSAADFSQMFISKIITETVSASDVKAASNGSRSPSPAPSSSSSTSAVLNSVVWYGISDCDHNHHDIKHLLVEKIVKQQSPAKVKVWYPVEQSDIMIDKIDDGQFCVVDDICHNLNDVFSEFFEWSLFCFLHPLHRLLLECGIVLSCDPNAEETQKKYDFSGGALTSQISRIAKPTDELNEEIEPEPEDDDLSVFDVRSFDIQRIDCKQPLPNLRFCFMRNFVGTPQYMMDLYRRLGDLVCLGHQDREESSHSADVKFLYVPRDTVSGRLFLTNLFGFNLFGDDSDSPQWILSVFVIKKPYSDAFVRVQFCKGCVCDKREPRGAPLDCKCCDERVARLFQKRQAFIKESGFEISTSSNDFESLQQNSAEFFDRIMSSINSDVSSSGLVGLIQNDRDGRKKSNAMFDNFFKCKVLCTKYNSDRRRRAYVQEDDVWAPHQNIAIHPSKYVFGDRRYLSEGIAKMRTRKALRTMFSSMENVEKSVDDAISKVGSDFDKCIRILKVAPGVDANWRNKLCYPHTPGHSMFRNLLSASYCCLQRHEGSLNSSGACKIHQVDLFQNGKQRSEIFHYFRYPESEKQMKRMKQMVVVIGEPLNVVMDANAVIDDEDVGNCEIQSFQTNDLQHPAHVLHYFGALEYPIRSPYSSTFMPLLQHLIVKGGYAVLILPGDVSSYVPESYNHPEGISARCSRLISVLEENSPKYKSVTFVTLGDLSTLAAKEYIDYKKHGSIFEAYKENGSVYYDLTSRFERTKWLEDLPNSLEKFIAAHPQQMPRHVLQQSHDHDRLNPTDTPVEDDDETQQKTTEIITWPDGKKKWQCEYIFGSKNGIETYFLPDGSVASTCEYISNQKHGVETHYFPDGRTIKLEKMYHQGQQVAATFHFNVFRNTAQYKFSCTLPDAAS